MSQSTGPQPDVWQAPWATPGSGRPSDDASAGPGLPVTPAETARSGGDEGSLPESPPSGSGQPEAFHPPAGLAQPSGPGQPGSFGQPGAVGQPTQPVPGPGYPSPGYPSPGYPLPGYSTQPLPAAGGPGVPPGPPGEPKRSRSGPSWGGVVAVGAGAAVLSSLLTVGVITATDVSSPSSPALSSAPLATGSQSAPLVTSSGSLPDWGAVASAVEPSVVSVKVSAGGSGGEGSGILLDAQGRILTNNHVIDSADRGGEIVVVLSDGRAYPAAIVGKDPATDLAAIKLNTVPSGLKPATLGDSSAVKVGDPVMAVGNPLGLSDTVTTGIVSALNRPVRASDSQSNDPFSRRGEPVITNAIQTDASINPGNSGGALVDSAGRIIGITSSIASLSSSFGGQAGSIGLGFAIPINEAKQIADELVSTGTVQHAFLGVTLADNWVSLDDARRKAAVIETVTEGTPAANAEIKKGDAIIAINGRAVDSSDSLIGTIRAIKPGTQITLTIVHDGKSRQVTVALAQRPSSNG